ncbi:hypothetical protein QOZ80_9AG0683280 [Eleusine coracana subsp. coracana]|nr:hypothetical protein QOZ80_9AG0683280 [Eleusine coracana subsp. coracana]
MAAAVAGAGIFPGWTHLPEDPPCLLYYSPDAPGIDAGAAKLYCPSTDANFRIPFPQLRNWSARGWLVVADVVGNLHLINPLTGGRIALPPITTLHGVEEGTSYDEDGNLAYSFHRKPGDASRPVPIPVGEAADCAYQRAVLSSRAALLLPAAGGSSCSCTGHFASYPTPAPATSDGLGSHASLLPQRNFYWNAAYNDKDGLFYSIYALDLNRPSPVPRMIIPELKLRDEPYRYLVQAPWGELLQVLRFRRSTSRLHR